MYRNQRQNTPRPKRDDAIARSNALFKSSDEVERETHTQGLADAHLRAEAERTIARFQAIDRIQALAAEHGFAKGELFA
jgi:hypothetical protein